jgi:hypothetical protein
MLSRTPKLLWVLMLAALVLPNLQARAAEASAADADKSWAQKYLAGYYLNWLTGMHTEALSGNRDGTGTNLEDDHFLAFGGRLAKNTKLMLTLWAAQNIDETTGDRNGARQFQPGDPYLTLSQNKIVDLERYQFTLDGYLRFYFPTSLNTVNSLNKGTATDYGHGMVRVYLSPTKGWFDGKLTFQPNVFWNYYFNSMSPTERFNRSTTQAALDGSTKPSSVRSDMYLILDPILDYTINSKVDIYLEWASGKIRHYTSGVQTDASGTHSVDGRWSSINHPTDGDYLSPGLNWAPTKKISVNPYLSYQLSGVNDSSAVKRRISLFHADIGLQAQYTFN